MKVIVIGHPPKKLPGGFSNTQLHQKIKEKAAYTLVKELKPELVVTGMAVGWDQWIAEICIENKIPFLAALPFVGQELRWPIKTQQHYKWLISKALKVVQVDRELGYVSSIVPPGIYHPSKFIRRDEWMVDFATAGDILFSLHRIARLNKSETAHTINYWLHKFRIEGHGGHYNWRNLDPIIMNNLFDIFDEIPF